MTLGGIAIGESLPAVISTYGTPAAARADASGNLFLWSNAQGRLRCTVDDDGRVNAVDETPPAGSLLTVDVDARPVVVRFGSLTPAQADEELTSIAEFASDRTRTYRLEPDRELVLSFSGPRGVLDRAVFGRHLTLVRAGVLPDDARSPMFPFAPARPADAATATESTAASAAIIRVELDRLGIARSTSVVVSSGDAAFDETVRERADGDRYRPATLAGRAIGSTLFREYPR